MNSPGSSLTTKYVDTSTIRCNGRAPLYDAASRTILFGFKIGSRPHAGQTSRLRRFATATLQRASSSTRGSVDPSELTWAAGFLSDAQRATKMCRVQSSERGEADAQ